MNALRIFSNDANAWTSGCEEELIKLYVDDSLPVLEISDIMDRSPGAVISRLMKLKVIATRQSARGYEAYKASPLYQEAIQKQKKLKKEKKVKFDKKKSNYQTLLKKYESLKDKYYDLDDSYEELEEELDELDRDYEELENDYIDLEEAYAELVRDLRAKDEIIKQLITYMTKTQ